MIPDNDLFEGPEQIQDLIKANESENQGYNKPDVFDNLVGQFELSLGNKIKSCSHC